jgi:hypothetical protein
MMPPGIGAILTLTMAAPRASVAAPAPATTIRQARSDPKLFEMAEPTMPKNAIRDASTKTGRLPTYSAAGTQMKFYLIIVNMIIIGSFKGCGKEAKSHTHSKTRDKQWPQDQIHGLVHRFPELDTEQI